jgi:hypothetical protein
MPDELEDQEQQAVSAFTDKWTQDYMMHGPAPEQAIRQAAQNAREDVEKLTKRFLLQGQDEINVKRQEVEKDINKTLGGDVSIMRYSSDLLKAGTLDGEPLTTDKLIEHLEETKNENAYYSERERDVTSYYQRNEAAWRREIWANPYESPLNDEYYPFLPDLSPIDSMLYHTDFVIQESDRIQQILENNGLTREDIERQNRIMDRELDIEPEP